MEQNINLLNSLPYKSKDFLSANNIVIAIGLWISLLVIISISVFFTNHLKQAKYNELGKKKNTILLAFNTLNSLNQNQQTSALTNAQLFEFDKQLATEGINNKGFATYLKELTIYTPDGLWLTAMYLSSEGMLLKGQALSAAVIPEFMHTINKSPEFAKNAFSNLQIDNNVNSQTVSFFLSTAKNNLEANDTKLETNNYSELKTDFQKVQARFTSANEIPEFKKS